MDDGPDVCDGERTMVPSGAHAAPRGFPPTSVISTFTLMKALDYTLNNMTLLALTLAVGIVIDDAIVVLENIFRYIEEKGYDPVNAAIEGTKEITLAVVATTINPRTGKS